LGLTVTWQEVEEGRANVVAGGSAPAVEKPDVQRPHGHVEHGSRGIFLPAIGYKPHAIVKDGVIYGLGIYNMKGALVCYTHAVNALHRAGVKLKGDVILAAVAGEIEKTQWGEYQGKEYRGYGYGTHYLVKSRRAPGHVHPRRADRHARRAGALRFPCGCAFRAPAFTSIRHSAKAGKK